MKFNYKLHRLCGAYYGNPTTTDKYGGNGGGSGSNIAFTKDGNILISTVSNRIQVIDLQTHTVRTLPIEGRSNIKCIAISPNDVILLVVDVNNYAMIVNFVRGVVLHRFKFKRKVRYAVFSPCGNYIAVSHGKHIQIWFAPNHLRKEFAPLVLHRTYTGQSSDVIHIKWSSDSSVIMASSRDCTTRIWTVHTTRNYQPVTLSGHKTMVVGAYFTYSDAEDESSSSVAPASFSSSAVLRQRRIDTCYTISEDGALVAWKAKYRTQTNDDEHEEIDLPPVEGNDYFEAQVDEALDFFTGGGGGGKTGALTNLPPSSTFADSGDKVSQAHHLVNCEWAYQSRHYFNQDRTGVVSTTYNERSKILAIGFSSGLFGLYEMPSVDNIHTLSVGSNQLISTCILNETGEWLALGCPRSQQLLVWEWRSETYVLKQRGHAYGMRCMAYSPDGVVVCTGGEDGKIKLWNASSGFCYVTFEQSHQAPVTSVKFANPSVVLSASLDGTVRAHDLHRYRTFKTMTTPTPVQFLSLAVDQSGEIVCAGSMDPFHIYAWNLQTGKILDVYTGHQGPVCNLAFQGSGGGTLVSASWDGSVKTWDLYKGNVPTESLQHNSDVVCVACRPDGKEICTGTINGLLSFWDVESSKLKYEIDGRRDISGGRKMNDRMTADNNASSRYFTSVCYSADGSCVLAGGNSRFVCIYAVSQQLLVKKFQVTFNRSLDGVLDELNSKNMTDFGPVDNDADGSGDETNYNAIRLPGAKRGDDGSRSSKVEVLTHEVSFSSTGREWAVVSGEGLHVYSIDDDMLFDPISLTETITPAAVESSLESGDYAKALKMAIHLNEYGLVKQVFDQVPYGSIPFVTRSIGPTERLMQFLAKSMDKSPHVEFHLQWCLQILQTHGVYLDKNRGSFMRAFRALHKIVQTHHDELKTICNENKYNLHFIQDQEQLSLDNQGSPREEIDKLDK